MKNILIFVLLFTGILSYIYETRKPRPEPEPEPPSEIHKQLEEELQKFFDANTEEEDPIFQPPGKPPPPLNGAQEAELREQLKAELAEELRREMEAELLKRLPTTEPTAEPEKIEAPEASPIEIADVQPMPTVVPTQGPDIEAMKVHITEQEKRIAAMRKIIQKQDQALSAEKSRIVSWKNSIRSKYKDETFSATKTRGELQQIQIAQNNWLSENQRQIRRKGYLANAEEDLKAKKAYLQQIR